MIFTSQLGTNPPHTPPHPSIRSLTALRAMAKSRRPKGGLRKKGGEHRTTKTRCETAGEEASETR